MEIKILVIKPLLLSLQRCFVLIMSRELRFLQSSFFFFFLFCFYSYSYSYSHSYYFGLFVLLFFLFSFGFLSFDKENRDPCGLSESLLTQILKIYRNFGVFKSVYNTSTVLAMIPSDASFLQFQVLFLFFFFFLSYSVLFLPNLKKQQQKETEQLMGVNLRNLSNEEKIAFYVNVHNAMCLHAFVIACSLHKGDGFADVSTLSFI